MAFHAFRTREIDPGRRTRLAVGALSAVVLVGGLLVGASLASATVKPPEEHEVEVRFVDNVPEEPAPPPPPPPAPEPKPVVKPQAAAAPPPPPPPPAEEVPTAIPTSTPQGDAPPRSKDGVPGGKPGGVAGGTPGGTGTGPVSSAPPAPPPAPPPGPKAIQLPEDADPPVAIDKTNPAYPDEARTQGVEATITVKFVVTESGDVTDVRVLRGHPLFDAAVIAAVRGWKYKPAMFAGKPIRVYRVVKIPFQLRR